LIKFYDQQFNQISKMKAFMF